VNHDRYFQSYGVLGLSSRCQWIDVRSSYRSLSKQWHPDRHSTEQGRMLANERMKEINAAYAEISAFYREHGFLPPFPNSGDAVPAVPPPDAAASGAWTSETRGTSGARKKSPFRTILILGIALVAGSVYLEMDWTNSDPLLSTEPSGDNNAPPQSPPFSDNLSKPPENGFGAGSSMEEVIAIQGAPTHVEDNVWHYGQSRVMFLNGAVLSWVQHPHHPLKTRAPATNQASSSAPAVLTFKKGSTMSDVRAIQGDPVRDHGTVWEYGASRVYFENGRVISWYESPLTPLKVRK
jgi:hypothetical protein